MLRLVGGIDALGGASVLAALVWLIARLEWTRSDINGVKQDVKALTRRVDTLTEGVSKLHGRQEERDRMSWHRGQSGWTNAD